MTTPDDDEARPPASTGSTPEGAGYRPMPPGFAPQERRRYPPAWVWLGILLGVAIPVAWVLLEVRTDLEASGGLFPLMLGAPLIMSGILFAASGGHPRRAGLALGLLIGWGVMVLVGAGVCVALITSTYGGL
jgi:hypothetical protein